MPALIEKGVIVSPLLDSRIFSFSFDYDDWPANHPDGEAYPRPYNQSLFKLRDCYREVFHEPHFEAPKEVNEMGEEIDTTKMYKITYKINILPMIDEYVTEDQYGNKRLVNEGYSFLERCIESEELDIFDVDNFRDLILFKWDVYGKNLHLVGFMFHLFYVTILTVYTYFIYILDIEAGQAETPIRRILEIILILGVVYPALFDWL